MKYILQQKAVHWVLQGVIKVRQLPDGMHHITATWKSLDFDSFLNSGKTGNIFEYQFNVIDPTEIP